MTDNANLVRQLLALLAADGQPTATEKPAAAIERPVLVTTQHRGVFFGYATDTSGGTIHLSRARMCVYWSRDMKGVLGLASIGPSDGCRISPAADLDLRGVTAVAECTPDAVAQWEKHPWSS